MKVVKLTVIRYHLCMPEKPSPRPDEIKLPEVVQDAGTEDNDKSPIQLLWENPTYTDALAEDLFEQTLQNHPELVGAQLVEPSVEPEAIIEEASVADFEVSPILEPAFASKGEVVKTLHSTPPPEILKTIPASELIHYRTQQEEVFYNSLLSQARDSTSSRRAQMEFLLEEPQLIADISFDLEKLLTAEQFAEFKDQINLGIKLMFPKKLRDEVGAKSITEVLEAAPHTGSSPDNTLNEKREKFISMLDVTGQTTSSALSPHTEKYSVEDSHVDESVLKHFGGGAAEMGYALTMAAEHARAKIGEPTSKAEKARLASIDKITMRGRRLMLRGEVMMALAKEVTDMKTEKIVKSFHREIEVSPQVAEQEHARSRTEFAQSFEQALAQPEVMHQFFLSAKFPEVTAQKTGMLAQGDILLKYSPEAIYGRAQELAEDSVYSWLETKMESEALIAGRDPESITDNEITERMSMYLSPDNVGDIRANSGAILAFNRALKLGSTLPPGAVDRVSAMFIAADYVNRLPPYLIPPERYADMEAVFELRSIAAEMRDVSEEAVRAGNIPDHLVTRYQRTIPRVVRRALVQDNDAEINPTPTGKAPVRVLGSTFDPALVL